MDAFEVFQFSRGLGGPDRKSPQKQKTKSKPSSLSPGKKSFSSSFSIRRTPDASPMKKSPTKTLPKMTPQAQGPVKKQIESLNSMSNLSTNSKPESIIMSPANRDAKSSAKSSNSGSTKSYEQGFQGAYSADTTPYERGCFQGASRSASSPAASIEDLFTYGTLDDGFSETSLFDSSSANCSPSAKPARKKLLTPKEKPSAKISNGEATDPGLSRSASSSSVAPSTVDSVYFDSHTGSISSKFRFFDGSRSSSKKDIPSLTRGVSDGSYTTTTSSASPSMISLKRQITSPLESMNSYNRGESSNLVQSPSSTTPLAKPFLFTPGPPPSAPQISRRMPSLNRSPWSENLVSTSNLSSSHSASSSPTIPVLTAEPFRATPPSYQRIFQQRSRPGTPKEYLPSSPLASLLELPLDDPLPHTRPLTLYGSPRSGSLGSHQSYGSGRATEAGDTAEIGLGISMETLNRHEKRINSFSSSNTEILEYPRSNVELKRRATNEADYSKQDCFPHSDTYESGTTPRSANAADEVDFERFNSLLNRTPAVRTGTSIIETETETETETDNIMLIEQMLEENYRGQAETCSRSSSLHRRCLTGASPYNRPIATFSGKRSATISAPAAARAEYETPTRQGKNESFAASQRSASLGASLKKNHSASLIQSPNRPTFIEAYQQSGLSPGSPHTYAHRIYQLPTTAPHIVKRQLRKETDPSGRDDVLYFTKEENLAIQEAVANKKPSCLQHSDCTDCRELEFSFIENKAMPTSMPPEERQKIINNNRSLRNIKNELESLSETNAISDDVYDQIMSMLPSESSLNASARSVASPSPAPVAAATNAFAHMRVNNDPPPPAYTTPTAPSLPSRGNSKPEIARATALYRYTEAEDCTFEIGDEISVFEYMNADWWLGKNVRTGKEGVFPVNYVQVQTTQPSPHGAYGNEKANNAYPGNIQSPPPPGPSNPYNSSVPPMAVAEQPTGSKVPGKGGEMGKKFGKKLGNAAIFGAGATIGGNIVNSIF